MKRMMTMAEKCEQSFLALTQVLNKMTATTAPPMILSRSGVFNTLGSLLSDVSSINSSESHIPPVPPPVDPNKINTNELVQFNTSFARLSFRQDLSSIEHIHIRCHPTSSFDPSIHSCLCEAVLGIFPDTISSSDHHPVLVRGVIERRHRRVKIGDWLLAINGIRLTWTNLDEILSKYRSSRTLRLTVRHATSYNLTSLSLLQSPVKIPDIQQTKLVIPEQIDCIHAVLYYGKRPQQGFELLYQQPAQKDIFFATGGIFPTLTQLMNDMNEHNNLLRSVSFKVADEQHIHACVISEDHNHYLILIYPPIDNLSVFILENLTRHVGHLLKFLFGSIHRSLSISNESIQYFFDIFFYRLAHLSSSGTQPLSPILKEIRLIDEFLPAHFNDYGACPKFLLNNDQILINIDCLLNRLECQEINACDKNENEIFINRFRRNFFVYGSILFHRIHLVTSHLSNNLTMNIYRFLMHYAHLNMSEIVPDTFHLLICKEIFPNGYLFRQQQQRSFLIACNLAELTLVVIVESEHEQDVNVSPDHALIHQIEFILNDIYSIFPKSTSLSTSWIVSSPVAFVKRQLKRTSSLPMLGGFTQSNTTSKIVDNATDDTVSLPRTPSVTDMRVAQLVSQPESQDELYKTRRQSIHSSTISIDEQQRNRNVNSNFGSYRLHPGDHSTIFYYLDFQPIRGLLIAPFFSLDKLTRSTLIDRHLFETIQQTCIHIRQKHFAHRQLRSITTSKCLFSTKTRPIYNEIGCLFALQTDPDSQHKTKKKQETSLFNFWIVGRQCTDPIEHEFFVCYHDSIAQNIAELAFTIGMAPS